MSSASGRSAALVDIDGRLCDTSYLHAVSWWRVLRAAIDAEDAIDHVTSSGDVEHGKPDPDILATAMRPAGADPATTVCIGDTVWDVEAARRLGLPCVCVITGGVSREELVAAGAAAVYDDAAALVRDLDRSPLAHLGR